MSLPLFKKVLSCACALVLVSVLAGCNAATSSASGGSQTKKVVATTSFINDMVKVVAGDAVERVTIIPAGEDPHIYQPTASDKEKLQSGDLILYHGLHFEGKMVDVLEKSGKSVSAAFPKDKIGSFEEDGQMVTDPHFWFDLDLYALAVQEVSKQLSDLLPDHKAEFEKNTQAYLAELKKLDEENTQALAAIPEGSRYLITPHDAFNYFAKRYKVEVVAPQGVSTEAEASLQGVADTVNFVVDHKVKAIFAESTTNPENMKKIQDEVKKKGFEVKVVSGKGNELFSDSLAPEGQPGDTFLDMYRHNVKLIAENLK